MFLTGGPPFSGTTLLTLLLNQGDSVCLDEPDFHKPEQRHRGIPQLQEMFPGAAFPPPPDSALTVEETVDLVAQCERAIAPRELGMKTCGGEFVRFAREYRARGYPVIAVVRDIRDVLVRPLPPWLTEASLNREFRLVWENIALCDLWFRYEDLVRAPEAVMARISSVLGRPLAVVEEWDASRLSGHLLKIDRHDGLRAGRIVKDRIGIWKAAGVALDEGTRETAVLMGY